MTCLRKAGKLLPSKNKSYLREGGRSHCDAAGEVQLVVLDLVVVNGWLLWDSSLTVIFILGDSFFFLSF